MWDVIQINSLHLSHDLPCPRCGHSAHIYLACSDDCDCMPAPMPGTSARTHDFMLQEDGAAGPRIRCPLRHIAGLVGMKQRDLRVRLRHSEVDTGTRPGATTDAAEEIKRPRWENAEPRRANEMLKSALALFAKELDRPTVVQRGAQLELGPTRCSATPHPLCSDDVHDRPPEDT